MIVLSRRESVVTDCFFNYKFAIQLYLSVRVITLHSLTHYIDPTRFWRMVTTLTLASSRFHGSFAVHITLKPLNMMANHPLGGLQFVIN